MASSRYPFLPGGILLIGQEQDSIGGDLSRTQALNGHMDDARIWAVVRTAQDIRRTLFQSLSGAAAIAASLTEGLVLSFTFEASQVTLRNESFNATFARLIESVADDLGNLAYGGYYDTSPNPSDYLAVWSPSECPTVSATAPVVTMVSADARGIVVPLPFVVTAPCMTSFTFAATLDSLPAIGTVYDVASGLPLALNSQLAVADPAVYRRDALNATTCETTAFAAVVFRVAPGTVNWALNATAVDVFTYHAVATSTSAASPIVLTSNAATVHVRSRLPATGVPATCLDLVGPEQMVYGSNNVFTLNAVDPSAYRVGCPSLIA